MLDINTAVAVMKLNKAYVSRGQVRHSCTQNFRPATKEYKRLTSLYVHHLDNHAR